MTARFWHSAASVAVLAAALLACKKGNQGTQAAASAGAPAGARGKASDGIVTVSQEQHASWVRNFNPLLTENTARWPTLAGVHEPLLIFNSVKGEYVPWLCTGYEWADGNKLLKFKIRPDVKWSDGTPFAASDVAFTFNLMKKFPATDLQGVWKFVETVRAPDAGTVEFVFKEVYVPALFFIGRQPIVPEHKWKDVPNPITYANPNPVGTGPFTEVKVFQNQVYELHRNPHYWQKGKPAIKGLRFPAFPSNDQVNFALLNGEIDWAANFVPDIEKVFVSKDPQHHHYWFALVGGTVMMYTNTTRKPFDDSRVRKAVSMAIDRAQIVKVAMYNYTRPADATGMSDVFKAWRNPEALASEDWTKYDVAKANEMLDAAGYKRGATGIRQTPDGKPLSLQIIVPTGWSDWVRAVQIIATNLKQIGVDGVLKTYDFSAWFDKVQKGDFEGAVGWTNEGPSPYFFYRPLMGSSMKKPLGEVSVANWHRYGNKDADEIFKQFERTADDAEQKALAHKMQSIFVQNAPAIPLFPSPVWGEYNDKRTTGFPNKENPYARLSTFPAPEYLLVMVELKPRG